MAISVTARHSAGPTTTGAQTQTTSSATPTASSLLLVFFGAERDNHTTAEAFQTPTGGGWTYTQRHTTSAFNWGGAASFAIREALYSAPVGGAPSAHTITVDSWSGTDQGFYSTLCCDVTGHDATTPFAQAIVSNGASVAEGSAHSGSVTLGSTPTVGNVVVVLFAAGADTGGGFVTPTLGGRTMTAVGTPQNGAFYQSGLWQLEIDGTETNNTITCADVGNAVGNWLAIAAEIAVDAGGAITQPVGQVTETDTAQLVGSAKTKTLGQPSETDTAQLVGAAKTKQVGRAVEADLAQQFASAKAKETGQATETDTARTVTAVKAKSLGLISETDTAFTITALKTRTIGQAGESDLAQSVTFVGGTPVGQATETDQAQPITAGKTVTLGQVVETDQAQTLVVVSGTGLAVGKIVAPRQVSADGSITGLGGPLSGSVTDLAGTVPGGVTSSGELIPGGIT